MPSILKLDSILLTLLSTVIRVSFLLSLSLSQKGICSSIVYHKTLHLYCKFSYYEERTYNLLRYHYHFKSSIFATFIHLLLLNYLKNKELQVLFEQMLEFTGFSGTRFLNLPLAYHSFFRYIKFAIRSISSVSVLSRTWQYRSIVICKEL